MHIKFEHVQAVDDKVIFQTSRKCCENFNQKEITQRHYEVQLWFFRTALCIIATNTNAKFQVNQAPPGWLSGERVGLVTWWL